MNKNNKNGAKSPQSSRTITVSASQTMKAFLWLCVPRSTLTKYKKCHIINLKVNYFKVIKGEV